jgi:nucleoside-diphosphate-sugar epimerase
MKVLITGVSGRLGPYVVKDLEAAGHELVLFSRREPSPEIKHWPWVRGDITNYEDCLRGLTSGGFDAIQHLAAQPNPTDHPGIRARSAEQELPFDTTMRSNIMGLYYLLQAALSKDVGVFVMTGSNCALGHGYRISDKPFPFEYLPVDEKHPSNVEDSYSYSKLAGEMLLAAYTSAYDIRTYAVRAAGICNEERRKAIAANAKPVESWNPWMWAWVGSEDVASAHRLLMEKAADIAPHGVFYCNGEDTTALEPSQELIRKFHPDLLPLVRELDGNASFLSNKALRQTVGWEHKTSWRIYLKGD